MYFCHLLLLFIMYFFQPLTPFCHFDKLFHLILLLILVMHPFFSCIMIVCNNYNDQILYFNLFPFFSHICIVDKHFMVSYVYIYKKKESTIMLLGQTLTGIITITRVNITITWVNECIRLHKETFLCQYDGNASQAYIGLLYGTH